MIGTGLAILGAGLLGSGAAMYGASKAADAQKDAANSAAAVNQRALDLQQNAFDFQRANFGDTKNNLTPFINNGVGANNLLGSFYGTNGTDPALGKSALDAFNLSPDYQFALKGGTAALDNSAAARGGVLGGNQIRAQTEYGQGLATQNLGNYLTRLSGLSQQGLTAGGYLGQIGATSGTAAANGISATANNIGNDIMAGGTADASGILGTTKAFNSGTNALMLYNQLGKSSFGSTGSGSALMGGGSPTGYGTGS